MRAKIIIAMATVAFVGTLSVGSEALARGGKGGHGGGKSSAWAGKSMHGMHGKHGHHFPGQMHHAHGKHDHGKHGHGHKKDHAQGVWHKWANRRILAGTGRLAALAAAAVIAAASGTFA